MKDIFNPKNLKDRRRESRDSERRISLPIEFYLDCTGSMGFLLKYFATEGLNDIIMSIYNNKKIENPQLMLGMIGDVHAHDDAPLQVTQFESDIRIAEQLVDLYFEGHGGGNAYESYSLAYYMSAFHVDTDAFEKRGQKGMLFTAGDEPPTVPLTASHINTVFGYTPQQQSFSIEELFQIASRKSIVYHFVLAEGNYARSVGPERVVNQWADKIGRENVILVEDVKYLSDIVSILVEISQGADKDELINSIEIAEKQNAVRKALSFIEAKTEHYW